MPDKLGLDFDVTSITFGIFGFLLLVMMVLRPEGFILPERRLELHGEINESERIGARADDTLYDVRQADDRAARAAPA